MSTLVHKCQPASFNGRCTWLLHITRGFIGSYGIATLLDLHIYYSIQWCSNKSRAIYDSHTATMQARNAQSKSVHSNSVDCVSGRLATLVVTDVKRCSFGMMR